LSITHSHVPSAWRAGDLGGHAAIWRTSCGESQVTTDNGCPLIPELKFSTHCHQSGKERSDCFSSGYQLPVTAVDDSVKLIKGRHSVDVSGPFSGNQKPLQILRIACGFMAHVIDHNGTQL